MSAVRAAPRPAYDSPWLMARRRTAELVACEWSVMEIDRSEGSSGAVATLARGCARGGAVPNSSRSALFAADLSVPGCPGRRRCRWRLTGRPASSRSLWTTRPRREERLSGGEREVELEHRHTRCPADESFQNLPHTGVDAAPRDRKLESCFRRRERQR